MKRNKPLRVRHLEAGKLKSAENAGQVAAGYLSAEVFFTQAELPSFRQLTASILGMIVSLMKLESYLFIAFFSLCVVLSGCIPGDAVGRRALRGTFENTAGQLPDSINVEILKLSDFNDLELSTDTWRNRTQTQINTRVAIDSGSFIFRLPNVVYAGLVWILPPLGGIPKSPPPPACAIVFSNVPAQIYVVGMKDSQFLSLIFDAQSHKRIRNEDAYWLLHQGLYLSFLENNDEVWYFCFQISKNAGQ